MLPTIVQSCNPGGVEIHTSHSFLVYPTKVNNSKEIIFASMGNGERILTVKTPRNYVGRKPVTDLRDQFLMRFQGLQDYAIK